MRRRSHLCLLATALGGVAWVVGCGDGATEPPLAEPPRATSVAVSPATARLTALGATVQLTAEVRDQNGRTMAGTTATWTSSSASVATVDGTGLVTAAANGTVTIFAAAGGVSGTAVVTVVQEVSLVAVSPATDTLVAGDTLRLTARGTDANGHVVQGTEFSWASGDTAVALVDGGGLVTGVGAGEVEITATSSGVSGSAQLVVEAPAATTVVIRPDTVAFTALGDKVRLATTVRDQLGEVMRDAPVAWSSSDTLVAAVDSAGLVTATGNGTATVTATSGEASGTALVTVTQSPGSVVVSPPADTIGAGDTVRLAAEAFDENGHRVNGAVFAWSSSDASVARVDGSGLVLGVAEGRATIAAEAGDSRGTSEITVQNPDQAALIALYNATDGPNWVSNDNWLTDAPLRQWYGVRTDGAGRIVSLHLSANNLSGPIPPALGDLSDLASLELTDNQLSGSIPAELGHLASLIRLNLGHNDLSGPIPAELGRLVGLRQLTLAHNAVSGPIPAEFGNLSNLRSLLVGHNEISGPIPPELGNLANLSALDVSSNHVEGPVPSELGDLANLGVMNLSNNDLRGPIPPELGNLSNLRHLDLGFGALNGSIPPELGNLANLTGLYLGFNDLAGPIPPELGNLVRLTALDVSSNDLEGSIPRSFLELTELGSFHFSGTRLCAPGTPDFVMWRRAIERFEGPACNETDVAVLESLYEAAAGPGWINSGGWLSDDAIGEWHGVSADSLGRVRELDLTRNGLAGPLPPSLGNLGGMIVLRIGGNALTGRLPPSLTRVPLEELRYAGTELCAPIEGSFRSWLNTIASHEGTGIDCSPLRDRDVLESLYDATGGPNWTNNANWLTDAPLHEWHGVGADGERVNSLELIENNLTGTIPPELGNLTGLIYLRLDHNQLSGSLPPELGDLANLRQLNLDDNQLSGFIPPELGNLAELETLLLSRNQLSGSIPLESGNLANLWWLAADENRLTGDIPAELGNLTNLKELWLHHNGLSGRIPAELGNLANLRALLVSDNQLTGDIPPELGNLASLEELWLDDNGLSGSIPPELGNLYMLEGLLAFDNRLTGNIPPELGRLSRLVELWLNGNRLSGGVPPELGNLANLDRLDLSENRLTALPPSGFRNTPGVRILDLSDNPLETPQAINFRGLANLETLILKAAGLSELPPGVFSHLEDLRSVDLRDNRFSDLPAGIFLGVNGLRGLRLEGNPGAPFSLTLEPRRTDTNDVLAPGPASVGVTLKQGAPFDLVLPLAVHGGDVSASRVVLEAGSDRSAEVGVTGRGTGQSGTQVVVGPAPNLPFRFGGVELRVADPLVLFGTVSNHAPVAARSSPLSRLRVGGEPLSFDVSAYFRDPDGDELQYTAVSENPDVVSAGISGDRATVSAVAAGAATVTVTATDPGGLSARLSFPASVRGGRPGSFDIDLILTDEVSKSIEVAFEDAIDYWSLILAGTELPDVPLGEDFPLGCWLIGTPETRSTVDDVVIVASVREIDGGGGILARAGWCGIRDGDAGLPFMGAMQFDLADLEWLEEQGDMEEVILHEVAHVLGVGTLWRDRGLLANPSLPDSLGADTHFTGALAIEAFNSAGGTRYTAGGKVPVENRARPGSGDTHWRESVLELELMTPYQNVGVHDPLSAITIQSLADLGYVVDESVAEFYRLPGAAAAAHADAEEVKIEYGDDILRGPIMVVDRDGRVVRVIPE